ncbi:MAG: hypothetical protein H0W40_10745 [Methylibium sp.]|uniref:hypothetical protein n=1 Tax=Methylibium sp. TaxID=2067992 RepID=UPI001850BB75|nr:hypothetical protein [Methylibium sp.]MBA3597837.1 hypothetical protein [Methylibium sp.]
MPIRNAKRWMIERRPLEANAVIGEREKEGNKVVLLRFRQPVLRRVVQASWKTASAGVAGKLTWSGESQAVPA